MNMGVCRTRAAILVWLSLMSHCFGKKSLLTVTDSKCVTSSGSAIGAIYNLDDEFWDRSKTLSDEFQYHGGGYTKLCPSASLNDCYFDGWKWQERNSLEPSPVNNLITDRRLEGFPTHLTKHVDSDGPLEYLGVALLNSNDFVIPFSLHARFEAHIYLCKGDKVHSSPCYWFLLQGWRGSKSALRTCPANEIQKNYNGASPGANCTKSTQIFDHSDAKYPIYLTGDRWSHFKIVKTGDQMMLFDADGRMLINPTLKYQQIQPKNVFLHTKQVNGMWKVHDFKYMFFDVPDTSTTLRFNVSIGRQCLSMFVAMCEFCAMQINFPYNSDNPARNLEGGNYKNRWQEVKMCVTADRNYLYLAIKTDARYDTRSTFWAISDITTGKDTEWRVLTPISRAWTGKCQYFENNWVLDRNYPIETLDKDNKCAENEFGEDCIPCGVISSTGDCPKQSKYCEMTRVDNRTIINKCHCSIGYKGPECKEICGFKSYGHGCIKSCSKCQNGCENDPTSGVCDKPGYCVNNFSGPKCDNPPELFIFDQLPLITTRFSSCDLEMQSFTGVGNMPLMKYYKFQYREVRGRMKNESEWQDVGDALTFNESKIVTFNNLKTASIYEVRVFGFASDEYKKNLGHVAEKIPVLTFTTKCRALDKQQIEITTSNSTCVVIRIKQDKEQDCNLCFYQISVAGQDLELEDDLIKCDLLPFTNYTLRFKQNQKELFSIPFLTKEGRPGKVGNFRYELNQNDPHTVTLLWEKPKITNGVLLYYTVSMQLKKLMACINNSKLSYEDIYVSPNKEKLVIPKLSAYALYSFTITANTSGGFGEARILEATTKPSEELRYDAKRSEDVIHCLFGGREVAYEHKCYDVTVCNDKFMFTFETLDQPIICGDVSPVFSGQWSTGLASLGVEISDSREPGPIELLLGADVAGVLYTGNQKPLSCGLTAIETRLGWTLIGKVASNTVRQSSAAATTLNLFVKDASIEQLWSLDVIGIKQPTEQRSREEMALAAKELFLETVRVNEEGRYEVRLPWVSSNYNLAQKRLKSTISKLKRDGLFEQCNQIFEEWESENIIERVDTPVSIDDGHYLPHRVVVKENSATTKLRPVFDASAHERDKPSLNHCLEKGLNLVELIPSLLLRFREFRVGVVSDIRKAFLQISVHKNDRDFLKFLWEDSQHAEVAYRFRRVVFGVNSSPFLLGVTLEYHLDQAFKKCDVSSNYSRDTIEKLRCSFYVDNCVTSLQNEDMLATFIRESVAVMTEGQFDLRGWEYSRIGGSVKEEVPCPVLGLNWYTLSRGILDTKVEDLVVTKREILSVTQKVFDPIGFTSPTVLVPKLTLQKLWAKQIKWDQPVDEETAQFFKKWVRELPYLMRIEIPRWTLTGGSSTLDVSIHTFCDASKDAYACAIFLRIVIEDKVNIFLLASKARVSPLKKMTIPRLELLAAVIGARLFGSLVGNLNSDAKYYFWSDSATVISWIQREDQWGTFVWNRVSEIRQLTPKNKRRHVPGLLNPADLLSRGCFPKQMFERMVGGSSMAVSGPRKMAFKQPSD